MSYWSGRASKIQAFLDIGSTKIACWLVKFLRTRDEIEILAAAQVPSEGYYNGLISDMGKLEAAIARVIDEIEKLCEKSIDVVTLVIHTSRLGSRVVYQDFSLGEEKKGDRPFERKNISIKMQKAQSVNEKHRTLLWEAALRESEDERQEVLHILPISYVLDGQEDIKDPVGMCGLRLGAHFHLITAEKALLANLRSCLERCHLRVDGIIAGSYAAGMASTVEDERRLGVIALDMGGGCTSGALFWEGQCVGLVVVPRGGQALTEKIASSLGTSLSYAERLKHAIGGVIPSEMDEDDTAPLFLLGDLEDVPSGRRVSRGDMVSILGGEFRQIFDEISQKAKRIDEGGLLSKRFVLSGGGSRLEGVSGFISAKAGRSSRLGLPKLIWGFQDSQKSEFAALSGSLAIARSPDMIFLKKRLCRGEKKTWSNLFAWLRENV